MVNQPAAAGALPTEEETAAVLAQVEWSRLGALTASDAEAYVVQPIQRALPRCAEAGQPKVILILAAILGAVACAHPSLCPACLATLTRLGAGLGIGVGSGLG